MTPPSLLFSLGSGGLLASWWAGSINTHCFPFAFLLGERALKFWEREGKSPCKPHHCRLLHWHHPLWYLDLLSTFCCYSSWQACCLQNLLTKSVYQSCSRTPEGGTQPTIWVTQLWHLSDFSLNSNLTLYVFYLSLMKRYSILNTCFATGHRQEFWWYKYNFISSKLF